MIGVVRGTGKAKKTGVWSNRPVSRFGKYIEG